MAKTPNIENLTKLRDWLNDGAPTVIFNMAVGFERLDQLDADDLDSISEVERNKPGIGECGTVCCIAGASARFDGMIPGAFTSWMDVAKRALNYLGLELNPDDPSWYGHDLFDPFLAPHNCTPQQAAQAVQNVMDGKEPWEGVK